ncbi:hypothetical protein [Glaciecola sp. 1036]|uniref:hypothetical protein n=1 Tax=Alteromonadaceae TaxID=72275 RepID=UPI003D058CCF
MKKCEIFEHLDSMQRKLNQVTVLSKIMESKSASTSIADNHQRIVNGIIADIAERNEVIFNELCDSISHLYIVNDAVTGDSD